MSKKPKNKKLTLTDTFSDNKLSSYTTEIKGIGSNTQTITETLNSSDSQDEDYDLKKPSNYSSSIGEGKQKRRKRTKKSTMMSRSGAS